MESISRAGAAVAAFAETLRIVTESPQIPLGRAEWSDRRWRFISNGGPKIIHMKHAGRGKPRREVEVKSHRLVPVDRTRYPGHLLRAARAMPTNFRGEARR